MQISTEELEGGVNRVVLDGRLDIAGSRAIDLKMNVIAGTKRALLVAMQKVSFMGTTSTFEEEVLKPRPIFYEQSFRNSTSPLSLE